MKSVCFFIKLFDFTFVLLLRKRKLDVQKSLVAPSCFSFHSNENEANKNKVRIHSKEKHMVASTDTKNTQTKMEKKQKNEETPEQQQPTTIYDLYGDCLVSIFAFDDPVETWSHRLICSHWHKFVPIALSRVMEVNSYYRDCRIRRYVDLCPNLKCVSFYLEGEVKKLFKHFLK